ncbi:thioredoxin family protein [Shewanella putrefaciens]|uniref:thioredoxin family protein n=1 Tax=Shewanella putrefaciens TaxID=24 RepID=UPI003D78E4D1
MIEFKILGSGCSKCIKTVEKINTIVKDKDICFSMVTETNPERIFEYRVVSMPAVVINERLVHWGSIPKKQMIESWLITFSR